MNKQKAPPINRHKADTVLKKQSSLSRVASGNGLRIAKQGNALMRSGQYKQAAETYLAAWEAAPDDMNLLVYVANALAEIRAQTEAITLLEAAIARHGATEDICMIIGRMALQLNMNDVAEKIFHTAISLNPQNISHYVNLTATLKAQEKYNEAIDLLQSILPIFPTAGKLWSNLATIVTAKDGEGSFEFHLEAMKYGAEDYEILTNYAHVADAKPVELNFADIGNSEAAYRAAIALDPKRPEAHVGLGIKLLAQGKLDEAWEHYEYRLDPAQGQTKVAQYTHKIRRWTGGNLQGKSLLVSAEQGIGDEVFFAMIFPALLERGVQLFIGCEPRLKTIYERSFPTAKIREFEDEIIHGDRHRSFPGLEESSGSKREKIDYEIPAASLPQYFWDNVDNLPRLERGFLIACPEMVRSFRKNIAKLGLKGKNIGLSWRSGKLVGERGHSYLSLELLKPLFEIEGLNFFNLQYNCDQNEIDDFMSKTGHTLHQFNDIDLKQDIEANLAIMENMDLIIGPSIATQMFAISLGKPTWFLTDGRPWWLFNAQEDDSVWFSRESRCFVKKDIEWDAALLELFTQARKIATT